MVPLVAGLIATALGLGLALNVLRSNERLASFSRPFPWWLKSPTSDNPASYRFLGVGLIVLGLAFIWAGGHP